MAFCLPLKIMSEESKPARRLYYFSFRWGVYSGLAAVTTLGIVAPALKLLSILVVGGYFGYMIIDIMNHATTLEQETRDRPKSIRWAFIKNADEILYFALAVIIGIFLGF